MPETGGWGVFADELRIYADGGPGADWWARYVSQQPDGRLTYLAETPSGGHVHVSCGSEDDAGTLLGTITGQGVSREHVKVATLAACRKAALSSGGRPAPLDAAGVALITALRAAPEKGSSRTAWPGEGTACQIARRANDGALLRAADLLRVPRPDSRGRPWLEDLVVEAARNPVPACKAETARTEPEDSRE